MQIHTSCYHHHHHHPFSLIIPQPSSLSLFPRQFNPQFKPKLKKPSPILSSSSNKTNPELLTRPEKPPAPDNTADGEPDRPSDDFGDALAPFLKFFERSDSESDEEAAADLAPAQQLASEIAADVKYYEPQRGDLVVGVVVSGNENKLDVNVGADVLGTMLTKEVMPMYAKELDYLLCDLAGEGEEEVVRGRMGVVRDEEALSRSEKVEGRPVVTVGTVVFAEVLGRTLSGRPLLSSRRMYRRVAWHRVRQVLDYPLPLSLSLLFCCVVEIFDSYSV